MNQPRRLAGARDVRVSLDGGESDRVVVACPPHPQLGGDRHDSRLRAVSDALSAAGIDCLRFDYGAWDEGIGERTDALTALAWAEENYEQVGLFGYSFGGGVALSAAASEDGPTPAAVSTLAPASKIEELDVVAALDSIPVPVQIVYGERDDTATWQPIVERARELGYEVESLPADHFFVSQRERVAETVVSFLRTQIR
ncbi:MAG: dienelactone hydrolase family protein [Halovenus sp.]|mgnify:CR=1 FL=1